MRTPSIRIAATVSISVVLALQGCATTKEDVFPKDMKPMSEAYDNHFAKLHMRGIESARVRLHEERIPPPVETSERSRPSNADCGTAHGFRRGSSAARRLHPRGTQ
jgi:hypothetical protein